MEDLRELWAAIKPRTKEDKIQILKDLGKVIVWTVIGLAFIYVVRRFS